MSCIASCRLFVFRSRVSPRRATYFSLLRQRKVGKRKATLLSVSLRFATGNLRCSAQEGVRRTRFAQTAAALIPPAPALLGTARREWDAPSLRSAFEQPGLAFASLGRAFNPSEPNKANDPFQAQQARSACCALMAEQRDGPQVFNPLWLRRGAQRFADKGRSCLSEASSADPAKREHRRLPRSEAKGSQTVGSPFLCLLSFGEAKESESAAGPRPGFRPPQGEQTKQVEQQQ
ncbi:hypothetical protein SAMN03159371_01641 [Variovorax sp. NFACC28]|nr:hypothetical protein SAMN03159371_01641 [Variovorax sp. NFACC28]SEG27634.1 hypothetical protein SAMN03159365_01722 [Variovorax sp. NFACC29]SFC44763.1 hypothetical protein SAMN03159379_02279 [Variovorax sp. NFACC26]SFF91614.1 hypothetical protein SAMN03159447_00855 [Variovorax sp. NFACC27]